MKRWGLAFVMGGITFGLLYTADDSALLSGLIGAFVFVGYGLGWRRTPKPPKPD